MKDRSRIKPAGAGLSHFAEVSGLLQRKCACGATAGMDDECAGCRATKLQRSPGTQRQPPGVPPIVYDVLRSPGQPLDATTRALMEPRFGRNFAQVRVHADPVAAESARAVKAKAYTVGNHIVIGSGLDRMQTQPGQMLLAHELTHVVQQSKAPLPASFGIEIETDRAAEQEAERAERGVVLAPGPRADPVLRSGQRLAPALQRQEIDDLPAADDMPSRAAPAPFVDLSADPNCPRVPTNLGDVPPDPPCPSPTEEIEGRHFEFCNDSDVFKNPDDRSLLIAFVLSRPAGSTFRVHAFASSEGGRDYNLNLSCHRAKRVARELIGAGVRSERIEIAAAGETSRFSTPAFPLQPNRVAIVEATAEAAEPPVTPLPTDPRSIVSLAVGKISRGEYRLAADAYLSYWSCGMVPNFSEAIRRTTIFVEGEKDAPPIDHTQPGAELGRVVQTGLNTIVLSKDSFDTDNVLECVMARIMDMSFHHMVSSQIPEPERHTAALYAVELAGLAPCRTKPTTVPGLPEMPGHDMWPAVTLDPRQGKMPPCAPGRVQGPEVTGAGKSKLPVPTFRVVEASFRGGHGNSLFSARRAGSLDIGSVATPPGTMRADARVQLSGDPASFLEYEIGYLQTVVEEERVFDYVSGHQIQQTPSLPMRDGRPTSRGGRPPWFEPAFVVRPDAQGMAKPQLSDSPAFTFPLNYLDLERSALPTGQRDPARLIFQEGNVLNRAHRHIVFHNWLAARRTDAPLDRFSTHFLDGTLIDFTQDIDLVGAAATGTFRATPDNLNETTLMQFTDPVVGDVGQSPRLEETFSRPQPRAAAGGLTLPQYHQAIRDTAEPIRRDLGLLGPLTTTVRIDRDTGRVALETQGRHPVVTEAQNPGVKQSLLDQFSQRLFEIIRKDLVLGELTGRFESLTNVPTILSALAP
jgi:outer membrane protein OmpA-like peptidoglycan-associated protein